MKLIVGLGNPGIAYTNSRHNIGFSIIRRLSQVHKSPFKKDRYASALSARVKIKNYNVLLALPLTFMNLSGAAVRILIKKYEIDISDLLVVCDDLDLEFGRLKIRPIGSSGGHRGIQSIIEALGSTEFSRLRVGVDRPSKDIDAREYVLSSFTKKEKKELEDVIEKAVDCCQVWAIEGIAKSMNLFNKRHPSFYRID